MAKNDTKTIFNVLSAKARKKEITNTDRKEVRQAVADLAAEIQGGYRLGRQEFDTLDSASACPGKFRRRTGFRPRTNTRAGLFRR